MTATPPRTGLWIVDERRSGIRVLAARGRIDGDTAPRLAWDLAQGVPGEPVALDLGAVEIADEPGVVLLLNAMRRLHARQRRLIVLSAQPALRRALDSRGLARRFELADDVNALDVPPTPSAARGGGRAGGGRGAVRATTATRRAVLLADATLVLERRHPDPDLSLPVVAREVATSVRQLQRVFADLAGSSFRGELAAVRMQHAAVLLQNTDLRVAEISRRVGYRHSSQFAKAFRRHHEIGPLGLRRTARPPARPERRVSSSAHRVVPVVAR